MTSPSTTPQSSPPTTASCMTPSDSSHISFGFGQPGSPNLPSSPSLPPVNDVLSPGDDAIFYKPEYQPSPGAVRRAKAQRENLLKRNHPYPSPSKIHDVAPFDLRFAARFLGKGSQPEFTNETVKQHEQKLHSGLSALSSPTLLRAFEAKQAAREAARQRLLLTAWEIEESIRLTSFLNALQAESRQQLISTESEVETIRKMLSARSLQEVREDAGYLQDVYDDQVKIFQTIDAQTEKVVEVLGLRGQPVADFSTDSANPLDPGSGQSVAATSEITNTCVFGNNGEMRIRKRAPLDIDDSSDEDDS